MHFFCECGKRISDTTDYISYKARIIADQDWFDFFDRIEEAIKSGESDKEKVIDEFWRDTLDVAKSSMYQCTQCGCIFINGEKGAVYPFKPMGEVPMKLLRSAKGEKWQGWLHAEWEDVKPEWSEHHGHIWPCVNLDYNMPGFDDYDEFEKKYYQVFAELKDKGVIRRASLKRNKQIIHSWDAECIEKRWNTN